MRARLWANGTHARQSDALLIRCNCLLGELSEVALRDTLRHREETFAFEECLKCCNIITEHLIGGVPVAEFIINEKN